jgi:3-deoxy-D-manno-octulosonic-acid transferase/heptosyltransferase-1
MKILIVKLSAIGDVLHTLPALNAIRAAYPSAHITWLVEAAAAPLVIGHSALDRIIVSQRKRWIQEFHKGRWKQAAEGVHELIRDIRDTDYDVILDFQAHLKSGVLIALARGRRKIGFDRGMAHQEHSYLFLNERIAPVDMDVHALERNLRMLAPLGIHHSDIVYRLPISPEDRAVAHRLLREAGCDASRPLICINPVAKWDTKLWRNERFALLADRLAERYRTRPVFTGAAEDHATVRDIFSCMTSGAAVDLTGKTSLKTLAAVYEAADVLISTDTGPMHLGAAVGIPVVALFGPTAPWRTGPVGEKHHVVRACVSCGPCFKRECASVECMLGIGVDDVMDRVIAVLDGAGKQ